MAKKAERKARDEAERRNSGVQPQTSAAPAPAGVAAVSPKAAKRAAGAARAGEIGKAGVTEGKPGA
jgi:hypothetical protein